MISKADENDIKKGLQEIIDIMQEEGKKKKKKNRKEEDFNHDLDEFEEIEEFNYLEGVL